jgi:hypothetical protein
MIFKLVPALFALLILGVTVQQEPTEGHVHSSRPTFSPVTRVYGVGCVNESSDIRMALQQLYSGEFTPIKQARNTLLGDAKRSSACRKQVIRALMDEMDKPDLDLERQISNYYIWREGSQLLGELKATEALDLLISHLDMTNGFHSFSQVFQPAILGVRQMGPAAIPKLTVALRQSSKPNVRMAAAFCLTGIGGVSAMNALQQAQGREPNKCVARFISISLSTFSYKSKTGRILFDNDAPQAQIEARRNWFTAFECVEWIPQKTGPSGIVGSD